MRQPDGAPVTLPLGLPDDVNPSGRDSSSGVPHLLNISGLLQVLRIVATLESEQMAGEGIH